MHVLKIEAIGTPVDGTLVMEWNEDRLTITREYEGEVNPKTITPAEDEGAPRAIAALNFYRITRAMFEQLFELTDEEVRAIQIAVGLEAVGLGELFTNP